MIASSDDSTIDASRCERADRPPYRYDCPLDDNRVAAGAAHARGEPGVFDRDVAVRDEGHRRVLELSFGVVDRHPDERPIGMVRTAGPRPCTGDDDSTVDLAGLRARVENPGDASFGIGAHTSSCACSFISPTKNAQTFMSAVTHAVDPHPLATSRETSSWVRMSACQPP